MNPKQKRRIIELTLEGDVWSGGVWHANVSGVVNGDSITGEASGTYTPTGEEGGQFSGSGSGTVGSEALVRQ